jgi:hypothetical protein
MGEAADFYVADKFFEAAVNLAPELLYALLRACTQIKAKRMLVKGGAYDATYQITVPRKMTGGNAPHLY